MSLIRKIVRLVCTGRHRSTVPTGLIPLSEIHSAVVYVDPLESGVEPLKLRLRDFFGKRGIELRIIGPSDKDIRTSSDLFIALNGQKSIDEQYAASSSTARFKVGRHQLPKDLYDCVVTAPGEENATVASSFDLIENLITNIQ